MVAIGVGIEIACSMTESFFIPIAIFERGIDWLESSLINGGDRVEEAQVPAPGAVVLLGAAGLVGGRRRRA